MSDLTKTEAMYHMGNGHKVAHRHFSNDEWMKQVGHLIEFEDGCQCEFDEFWNHRTDDSWLDGWRIVD